MTNYILSKSPKTFLKDGATRKYFVKYWHLGAGSLTFLIGYGATRKNYRRCLSSPYIFWQRDLSIFSKIAPLKNNFVKYLDLGAGSLTFLIGDAAT
jgi:hypothetical protein